MRYQFTNINDTEQYFDISEEEMKESVQEALNRLPYVNPTNPTWTAEAIFGVTIPKPKLISLHHNQAIVNINEQPGFISYSLLFPTSYISIIEEPE